MDDRRRNSLDDSRTMNDRSEKPQLSLRDIFLEAAEIEEASARAAFLEAACAGDTALRRRLDQLLAAEAAAGPPGGRALGSRRRGGGTGGARVGRYKLLQQIGEGGCGVVFMAEQEEPVRRRVALKVIKLGMDRSEEHTSELQSHSFISYAVFCLKKKTNNDSQAKVVASTWSTERLHNSSET